MESDIRNILHIHLDPIGGIAGDMFIAAMLDAFPAYESETFASMFSAGLPKDWNVRKVSERRGGLAGSRLLIIPKKENSGPDHKSYRALRGLIGDASITPAVRDKALLILEILAEAEAEVHGVSRDEIHFHELAGWDSLADLVACAWLMDRLQVKSWSIGPLPMGSGRVTTAHGQMPIPVPATAELLRGMELIDDGISGERITPTGAALVKLLQPVMRPLPISAKLVAIGTGLGSNDFEGISNCLRILAFSSDQSVTESDLVGVIEFFVDDQTPEDIGIAVSRLVDNDRVFDIQQIAAIGRKGRLGNFLTVMCEVSSIDEISELCFKETTTIGLRTRISKRKTLYREHTQVKSDGRLLAAKRTRRPGGDWTTKIESDAIANLDLEAASREQIRRMMEGVEEDG